MIGFDNNPKPLNEEWKIVNLVKSLIDYIIKLCS